MQTVFMQIVHKYNHFGFQYGLHVMSVNFNFSVLAYDFYLMTLYFNINLRFKMS